MKPFILTKANQSHVMEENSPEDESLGEDGFVLSQDDILQVIELGDDEPLNGKRKLIH